MTAAKQMLSQTSLSHDNLPRVIWPLVARSLRELRPLIAGDVVGQEGRDGRTGERREDNVIFLSLSVSPPAAAVAKVQSDTERVTHTDDRGRDARDS